MFNYPVALETVKLKKQRRDETCNKGDICFTIFSPNNIVCFVNFLFFLTSNWFYQDGNIYSDVRDEARAPIGCWLSPMRSPLGGADSHRVWWMREPVCLSMCVSVGRGSSRCRGSQRISVTVQWTISERKGRDPIDQRSYTHIRKERKRTWYDDRMSQERERKSHLLSNVSVLDTNIVKSLESNTK